MAFPPRYFNDFKPTKMAQPLYNVIKKARGPKGVYTEIVDGPMPFENAQIVCSGLHVSEMTDAVIDFYVDPAPTAWARPAELSEAHAKYANYSSNTRHWFECQLPVITQTEKAVCFNTYAGHLDHEKPVWIPKSQMEIIDLGPDAGVRYFIKNWLYNKLK